MKKKTKTKKKKIINIRQKRKQKGKSRQLGGDTLTHQSFDVFNNVHVPWIDIVWLYIHSGFYLFGCLYDRWDNIKSSLQYRSFAN